MVSGIGPKETLDNLDIPIISERAGVGQNMVVCKILLIATLLKHDHG